MGEMGKWGKSANEGNGQMWGIDDWQLVTADHLAHLLFAHLLFAPLLFYAKMTYCLRKASTAL